MKVEFHRDKKVVIKKPGIFNGMTGTIKTIKIEVDFGFSMGVWSFNEAEIDLVEGLITEVKPLDKKERAAFKKAFATPDDAVLDAVKEAVEKSTGKRVYTKRGSKPKADKKTTRKYIKKVK